MKTNLPDIFDGQTVTILGGGPSLEGFDFHRLRQPIIAVNSSFMKCDCHVVVATDPTWEKEYQKELDAFNGLRISYTGRNMNYFHEVLIDGTPESFSEDWCILSANLSGFFALSLAFALGAARVILLGFDGGYEGEKATYYPNSSQAVTPDSYEKANDFYDVFILPYKDRILNVGLNSKIKSFPKVDINSDFYTAFISTEMIDIEEKTKYHQIWSEHNYRSKSAVTFPMDLIGEDKFNGHILEVGCGDGYSATILRDHKYDIVISDITLKGLSGQLLDDAIECPVWSMPFEDNSFDCVYSTDVLEHVPTHKIQDTLCELKRITKGYNFHQIATFPDVKYSGHEVHLTVRPIEWWNEMFRSTGMKHKLYERTLHAT